MSAPKGPRDITRAVKLLKKALAELTLSEYDPAKIEEAIFLLERIDARESKLEPHLRKKPKAKKRVGRRTV